MFELKHTRRAVALVAGVGGMVLVLGTGVALAGKTAGSAHANVGTATCRLSAIGQLRMVPLRSRCKQGETLQTWHQNGLPGATGAAGKQGDVGAAGANGKSGALGARGPAGQAGAGGHSMLMGTAVGTAVVGAQGLAGPPGATGPEGAIGARGVQGLAGLQGAPGLQGPPGRAASSVRIAYLERTIVIPANATTMADYRAVCPAGEKIISGNVRAVSQNSMYTLGTSYADDAPHSSAWVVQLAHGSALGPPPGPPGFPPPPPRPATDGTARIQIVCMIP